MASTFCLPKNLVDKFLKEIKSGKINPDELVKMTSAGRNALFSKIAGATNAKKINALFESKLLLKNQQLGIINWAKQLTGINKVTQMDMISKVQRMTEILKPENEAAFLNDLANQRLKVDVTYEEAGKIADLAAAIKEKMAAIPENSPIGSSARIEYGTATVLFKRYVGGLKEAARKPRSVFSKGEEKLTIEEFIARPGVWVEKIGGVTKSIAASMDNSFFGRQGLFTLVNKPDIWIDNFAKSFGDMASEIKGIDAMLPIQADVFSRPNALNGKYAAMGLDIGLGSEEAFPEHLPGKIPGLGRLYKASETAYNGAALRMRADLADAYIAEFESMGEDIIDPKFGLGRMINSMTGRGKIALTPSQSKFVNATIFSVKFFKATVDNLTAHAFDPNVSKVVKWRAAKNLLKVLGVMIATLGIAKVLDPDSVELDPRSSNFGKLLLGEKRDVKINVTAGMSSLITLAARVLPSTYKGKLGFWFKTSKGRYIRMGQGKYGQATPKDLVVDFFTGKASPMMRTALNFQEGRTFDGGKPTVIGEIKSLSTPIPIQNIFDLLDSSADVFLLLMATALDFIGVNSSTKFKRKKR